MLLIESRWWMYRYSLYNSCNFSLCLKIFTVQCWGGKPNHIQTLFQIHLSSSLLGYYGSLTELSVSPFLAIVILLQNSSPMIPASWYSHPCELASHIDIYDQQDGISLLRLGCVFQLPRTLSDDLFWENMSII